MLFTDETINCIYANDTDISVINYNVYIFSLVRLIFVDCDKIPLIILSLKFNYILIFYYY